MKKPRVKRRIRLRPLDLRREFHRERLARMLLVGMSIYTIAKKLKVSPRTVRYHVETESFAPTFHRVKQELFSRIDRKLTAMLWETSRALLKNLRSSNWRCRASAIEQVLKVHGRYTEKIDLTGSLNHAGVVGHVHEHHHQFGLLSEDAMTPRQRELARELLTSVRASQQKSLPPALLPKNGQVNDVRDL